MSPNLMGQWAGIPHRGPPVAGSLHRERLPWETPAGSRVWPGRGERDSPVLCLAMPQQAPIPGCVAILEFANKLACVPCTPCVPGDWQLGLVILLTWPWQAGTLLSVFWDWDLPSCYAQGLPWITKMKGEIIFANICFPFCLGDGCLRASFPLLTQVGPVSCGIRGLLGE